MLLLYNNPYYSSLLKDALSTHGIELMDLNGVLPGLQFLENNSTQVDGVIVPEYPGDLDAGTIVNEIKSSNPCLPILGLADSEYSINRLLDMGMEGAISREIDEKMMIRLNDFLTEWGLKY